MQTNRKVRKTETKPLIALPYTALFFLPSYWSANGPQVVRAHESWLYFDSAALLGLTMGVVGGRGVGGAGAGFAVVFVVILVVGGRSSLPGVAQLEQHSAGDLGL